MATLYLAVQHATPATRTRAVKALRVNGVFVDAAWLDDSGGVDLPTMITPPAGVVFPERPEPVGWMKWAALVVFLSAIVLLMAWPLLGDWRFGAGAGVAALVSFFLLSGAMVRGIST